MDEIVNSENQIETDKPWLWKKGQSGNPKGRPKKKSFRDYFSEEEEAELMERVKSKMSEKEIMKMIVEQLFGKPKQPLVGGDEEDNPIRLFNYVRDNNGNSKDTEDDQENQSDTGGNISE